MSGYKTPEQAGLYFVTFCCSFLPFVTCCYFFLLFVENSTRNLLLLVTFYQNSARKSDCTKIRDFLLFCIRCCLSWLQCLLLLLLIFGCFYYPLLLLVIFCYCLLFSAAWAGCSVDHFSCFDFLQPARHTPEDRKHLAFQWNPGNT